MNITNDGSVNFGDQPQVAPGSYAQAQPALSSTWNYHYEPNQIDARLSNVTSLQLMEGTVSASRKQMFGGSHIQQCLVFDKATPRRIQTGQEMEYGKATFATKVERDAHVLEIIPFYNDKTIGLDGIKHNPEDVVILEYQDTGEIDFVTMKEYFSNHQYFGFKYKNTDKGRQLHSNRYPIAAGTILQDSPSKRPDGNYCYGANFNVLFATFPEAAEDGITISEEIVPWLTTRKYEKRTVTYGSTHFAVNLFGDDKKYKPFKDIGEYIREDGLLMLTRSYNENFSPVEMSVKAMQETHYIFDKQCCVSPGRGRVVDIRVIADPSRQHNVPGITNEQAIKYDTASRVFYRKIWSVYNELKRKSGSQFKCSHAFDSLVSYAYGVIQAETNNDEQRVQQIYRGAPMDDVTIEFVIEYEVVPTTGFKFTDTLGGKGVAVRIVPKEDMPVDARGNRAHVVMDSIATVSRQNISRLYEQFFNACSRDLTHEFCDAFALPHPPTHGQKLNLADKMRIKDAFDKQDPVAEALWQRFVHYHEIITPLQADFYHSVAGQGKRHEHVIAVIEDGIYLFLPTDNDPELPGIMDALVADFMPFIGPVTYRGHNGEFVTTNEPMLIGEVYFVMLEKTGDDCSAVSSGKLQGIGILAHIKNQDKYSSPWREQSIRFWGETETSIGTAYMGGAVVAELHNRNNSIASHRDGVYNILRAKNPMDIDRLVDRNKIPLSGTKPVELVKHLGMCAGWEIAYAPYVEMEPKPEKLNFVA